MRRIFLFTLGLTALLACGKNEGTPVQGEPKASEIAPAKAPAQEAKPAAQAQSYKVRGVFKGMEADSGLAAIQHEAIPDFKNRDGEKTGMMSMQMSFRVAEGVDAASLAVGDKIEFDFVVDWDRKPAIQVTSFTKLGSETELKL